MRTVRSRLAPFFQVIQTFASSIVPEKEDQKVDAAANLSSVVQGFSLVCEELFTMPLSEPDAFFLELIHLLSSLKENLRTAKSMCSTVVPECDGSDNSSSEDEPPLDASLPANVLVSVGCKQVCKVAVAAVEDVCTFINEQYEYEQNLCWNCYGISWLSGVLRITQALTDAVDELLSVVHPVQSPETVLRCARYVRLHLKALLDISNGHDQFQECEIASSNEVFKSGHHWSHQLNKRLQRGYDTISSHLYRFGAN